METPKLPAGFKELSPTELWGGNILLADTDLNFAKQCIRKAATATGQNCFGYFVGALHNLPGSPKRFHMSRYPRAKYGPFPTDEALASLMHEIISETRAFGFEEPAISVPSFRTVLGLREGYTGGVTHHFSEARSFLDPKVAILPAEIYAVRVNGTNCEVYEEPAVYISGGLQFSSELFALTLMLKQHRYSFENLETKTAHIVETPHCDSPDP